MRMRSFDFLEKYWLIQLKPALFIIEIIFFRFHSVTLCFIGLKTDFQSTVEYHCERSEVHSPQGQGQTVFMWFVSFWHTLHIISFLNKIDRTF